MNNDVTITLEGGKPATVVRGGTTVKFNENGGVEVRGNAQVLVHPAANDSDTAQRKATLEIGDKMQDGTIFAGVSPDTGRNLFVMSSDAPLTMKWNDAMKYTLDLDASGHKDWKLPSKAELDVLYQNRHKGALKGTFNENGSGHAHWYWSCTELASNPSSAWTQRFTDGADVWDRKDFFELSVRCVRAEPRPGA